MNSFCLWSMYLEWMFSVCDKSLMSKWSLGYCGIQLHCSSSFLLILRIDTFTIPPLSCPTTQMHSHMPTTLPGARKPCCTKKETACTIVITLDTYIRIVEVKDLSLLCAASISSQASQVKQKWSWSVLSEDFTHMKSNGSCTAEPYGNVPAQNPDIQIGVDLCHWLTTCYGAL